MIWTSLWWHSGRRFCVAGGLGQGGATKRERKWASQKKGRKVGKATEKVLWKLLRGWTTKRMKVKQWKDLVWFAKELILVVTFWGKTKWASRGPEQRRLWKLKMELSMALLWEQIVIDNFVGCSWGNVSRIKWQHHPGEKREDSDNVENSSGVCAAWIQKLMGLPTTVKQSRQVE